MLRILIEGAALAPKWITMQKLVRQTLDTQGRVTRIARADNGTNYRAVGVYHLTFQPDYSPRSIDIVLEVKN